MRGDKLGLSPEEYKERRRLQQRASYRKNMTHDKRKAYILMKQYGITLQQYDELWESQGGKCALCETPDNPGRWGETSLHVDHDHDSDEVRGLLCFNCNAGLGQFKDDVNLLQKAINYLLFGA